VQKFNEPEAEVKW